MTHFFARAEDILRRVKECGNAEAVSLTVPIKKALGDLGAFLNEMVAQN